MFERETLAFQINLVKRVLSESEYNVTKAALLLGLSRSGLTKFMARNGIKREYK